jgi:putative ABC transport system permease protein
MLRKFLSSFLLAFHNIRSHFFHTLLSVLGIVIGVASLVSILSLIDGMEDYAKEQIATTTSINAIMIHSQSYHRINGVRMRKDSVPILDFVSYQKLRSGLSKPATTHLRTSFAATVAMEGGQQQIGAMVYGMGASIIPDNFTVEAGTPLTDEDIESAKPYAVINQNLAKAIDSVAAPASLIGKSIRMKGKDFAIRALVNDKANEPRMAVPITIISKEDLSTYPPEMGIVATDVRDVGALKKQAQEWLKNNYKDKDGFSIQTNEGRVEQAARGFLLFRIIMGLIVGISVVVGGIGIMNVLLISITERTVEIGIRKAVGANRRDIIFQFLAESVTVSAFGSLVGLVVGVSVTAIAVPIIKNLTEIPFYASYTLNTLAVTGILAIALGIIFGTYPAVRASRLNPVDAIRHE